MKRLAVLGSPVAHSRSPAMHSAALEAVGLADELSYEAIEVAPADFEEMLRAMPGRGFVGANVTIPHKEAALALADEASEAAGEIGAANTLAFADGRIAAHNTDAPGLIASLPRSPAGARALVLGAGGSARAAAWALQSAGAEVSIANRTAARAERLAGDLGVAIERRRPLPIGEHGLLVNATSVGMERPAATDPGSSSQGSALKALAIEADQMGDRLVVVDLVYGSVETELVRAARRRGAVVVDGFEILARQGAESFRIWTGVDPPIEVMRQAARPPNHR